ncbi:hypothetical protein V6N11_004792 [Hibiscus sabdariffa]|uniref:Uncharacterized protein n=1 Tax=Hibiscus sabdariffa TaxID=183260 RepID=A0ABR2SI65_9ROSI
MTEQTTAVPRREETRSLMAPKMVTQRKKKRRVKVATPFSMTPEWKPSLYAISEDNVMTEKREKTQSETTITTTNRVMKRKKMLGLRFKIHVRSHNDDMGRNTEPVVLPTFSPTPFMF